MLRSFQKQLSTILVIIFAGAMFGCDKFEGEQTIPSYVRMDSISFSTEYSSQGTSYQRIVDAWVYVNDQLIGGFELPLLVPVLAEGPCTVEIRPGIMLNGISSTRAPYPCVEPITIENFDLSADSISILPDVTATYLPNVEFVWMEDFEDGSLSIKEHPQSDTTIERTEPANSPDAFLDEHSRYSGIATLEGDNTILSLQSDDGNGNGFMIDRGDFVFLELNYRTDLPLVIGTYVRTTDQVVVDRPFIGLNSTEDWNKVYVNFTPVVNDYVDAYDFKIYIKAENVASGQKSVVMLDNIKLLTRPNL